MVLGFSLILDWGLYCYGRSIARVLLLWCHGLLVILRSVLRLRMPAIRLRIVRTGKSMVSPVLNLFLSLLFDLILLSVVALDEISAGNYFQPAEDHDVTLVVVVSEREGTVIRERRVLCRRC